jgi:malonate-semialdehyde dehydrogenase (acetylating) / methylmalonate-semialdehyde dehydrogenase
MTTTNETSSYPPQILQNYIGGTFTTSSSTRTLPVTNPFDGSTLTSVVLSSAQDLDSAVQVAQKAYEVWSRMNVKTRVLKLMRLHQLMTERLDELAEMVVREHGKNVVEAKASITKGMETLEVRSPSLPRVTLPQLALLDCFQVCGTGG